MAFVLSSKRIFCTWINIRHTHLILVIRSLSGLEHDLRRLKEIMFTVVRRFSKHAYVFIHIYIIL